MIEARVEMFEPMPVGSGFRTSETPAGRAAMTFHTGPYSGTPRLGHALLVLHDACVAELPPRRAVRSEDAGLSGASEPPHISVASAHRFDLAIARPRTRHQ